LPVAGDENPTESIYAVVRFISCGGFVVRFPSQSPGRARWELGKGAEGPLHRILREGRYEAL